MMKKPGFYKKDKFVNRNEEVLDHLIQRDNKVKVQTEQNNPMSPFASREPFKSTPACYYSPRISVMGLGKTGLSNVLSFSSRFQTIGFDRDVQRVNQLLEVVDKKVTLTTDVEMLRKCNFFIIAVDSLSENGEPTDIAPLVQAGQIVAEVLQPGDTVVYDTPVHPDIILKQCVSAIEKKSGLFCNKNFFVAYRNSRSMPSDPNLKLITGCCTEIIHFVEDIYAAVEFSPR